MSHCSTEAARGILEVYPIPEVRTRPGWAVYGTIELLPNFSMR